MTIPLDAVTIRNGEGIPRNGIVARLVRRPTALLAMLSLTAILALVVLAPLLTSVPPNEIGAGRPFEPPSGQYLFGTDELGRDLWSRMLYGGRLAMQTTILASVIAIAGGTALGALAVFFRGWFEEVLMRVMDAAMAVPVLLLALVAVAAVGPSLLSVGVILGVLHIPVTTRVMRIAYLNEYREDYVRALRGLGVRPTRLLVLEVGPNVVPTVVAQFTLVAASVLLNEAALSFIGLGIQPPEASWGGLLLQGYQAISTTAFNVMIAGSAIFATVLCLNTLGTRIQEEMSPRGWAGGSPR